MPQIPTSTRNSTLLSTRMWPRLFCRVISIPPENTFSNSGRPKDGGFAEGRPAMMSTLSLAGSFQRPGRWGRPARRFRVSLNHLPYRAGQLHAAMVQPQRAITQDLHGLERMGHAKQRLAGAPELHNPLEALAEELLVSDTENLVDDQDVGIHVDGNREGQPHAHARGVSAQRLIDEVADAGELHNAVEPLVHLSPRKPQKRGVDPHVFGARQVSMKSRAQFEQGRHAAVNPYNAFARRTELGCDIQQGALACAVLADYRQALAAPDGERDIAQSEKKLTRLGPQQVPQTITDQHLAAVPVEVFRNTLKNYN